MELKNSFVLDTNLLIMEILPEIITFGFTLKALTLQTKIDGILLANIHTKSVHFIDHLAMVLMNA